MDEALQRLVLLILVLVVVLVLGVGVLAALMVAWRNYNRREKLLDQGRKLRAQYRGEPTQPDSSPDVWGESGKRLDDPGPGLWRSQKPPDAEDDDSNGGEGDAGKHG